MGHLLERILSLAETREAPASLDWILDALYDTILRARCELLRLRFLSTGYPTPLTKDPAREVNETAKRVLMYLCEAEEGCSNAGEPCSEFLKEIRSIVASVSEHYRLDLDCWQCC